MQPESATPKKPYVKPRILAREKVGAGGAEDPFCPIRLESGRRTTFRDLIETLASEPSNRR